CETWGGPGFRYPFSESTFREDMKLTNLRSWSLTGEDGAIFGFGQCYLRLERCHLARLAVAPGLRNQGLGKTLVQELCRRGAEELGTGLCSLFVLHTNTGALRLYNGLGFTAAPYPEPAPLFDNCIYMVAPSLHITRAQ
ncbi:MAG: GNAT family N-acetyltransferase, partial [Lysobacterales bacterium]